MKFVSSRELRNNPGRVWRLLRQEEDLVVTSSGKPVAVLTDATEENLEEVLATLRQGRAQAAAAALRRVAVARGLDKLPEGAVQAIIRKARRSARASGRKHAGARP